MRNKAQQLIPGNRWIGPRHGIALSDAMRAAGNLGPRYQAMGTQSALPPDEHDVSDAESILRNALDHQSIAGPDSWEHAPTRSHKTKTAKRTQNLSGKVAPHSGSGIRWKAGRLPHDTFVVPNVQIPLALVQLSAEVTKTCS
jgi:hypothetical protein